MKIPIVKQHDQKDCGAACLSMVSRFFGLKLPLVKCRELIKVDNDGSNMFGLIQGAADIGLDAEALEGSVEELLTELSSGTIKPPFIARIISEEMFEHFVVVYKITDKKVIAGDPAKGKVSYPIELFKEIWTGHIVSFTKTANFKKGNFVKGSYKKFTDLIVNQKKLIFLVVIISLLISAISLIGSMVFEYIANSILYTDVNNGGIAQMLSVIFSNIDTLCISVIGLYLFQSAMQVLRSYLLATMSKNIDIPLTMNFYKHLIHLPINFFGTRKSGEILSRFSDTTEIREAVSSTVLTLIIDSIMALFFGAYLCFISVPLFLIALSMVVSYAIVVFSFKKPIKHINQTSMESNAQMTSYLKETIDGVETVKAFGNEKIVCEKAENIFTKMINMFVKGSVTYSIQDAIVTAIASIGVVVLLWVGNYLCCDGLINIGSMITFYVILNYFLGPIRNLIEIQPKIQTALVAAERTNDILEVPVEEAIEEADKISLKGDIFFDNICFRYGYRKLTVNNLSIKIKQGSKVAIVGESGSGKTTLMKLLMSFYKPEIGNIYINDINLSSYSPKSIRDRIAYVPQNVFFFSNTIKNNLIMGNTSITDEQIEKTCKLVKADEFIQNLPMGYETVLSENASNLSGGQRQRLSIARALLRNPDILILDEATSNLDTITEQSIKNTIFDITKGVTTFIIAHRLSTIKNCDLILVMENGKIVESGTHDNLMEQGGKYKSYWDSNM